MRRFSIPMRSGLRMAQRARYTPVECRVLPVGPTKMCRKRLCRKVNNFALWCRGYRDRRIAWIMGMVKAKLRGIRNYFNFPGNSERMKEVETLFQRKLYFWMNRRSERKSYNKKTFMIMWKQFMYKKSRRLSNDGIQLNFLSSMV
jgi:RNA-directed DNA polymerase